MMPKCALGLHSASAKHTASSSPNTPGEMAGWCQW